MDTSYNTDPSKPLRITIIGAGTIGLSFASLHLSHHSESSVTIYDPRPNLEAYIYENLPPSSHTPFTSSDIKELFFTRRLQIASDIQSAVYNAHIVQEQGPENPTFKQAIWKEIELNAPFNTLFWSSTSGIPASVQAFQMRAKSRLIVVHPYNPPHIMPLLEIVPSPVTDPDVITRTMAYWSDSRLGKVPIVIKKEVTGFVANRLAFALFREAIQLVDEGVVSPYELDRIVESSMGPRWMLAGPFKSYHAGGGEGGLELFLRNIGGTVQACWEAGGKLNVGKGEGWEERIVDEVERCYGKVVKKEELEQRNKVMRRLFELKRDLTKEEVGS